MSGEYASEHLIFLSSEYLPQDSAHQKNNNFVTSLGKILKLKGRWVCSLLQMKCPKPVNDDIMSFFVCTNICAYSHVGQGCLPTLLYMSLDNRKRKTIALDMLQPIAIPVIEKYISHIRMYISDAKGAPVSLSEGEASYTLRLEKLPED